jgi:hypothetical protein
MTTKRGGLLVLYCALAANLEAQSALGSFEGTVRGPSGSPVSLCVITITSVATGATRSFLTDAGGNYKAHNLQPGKYEILMEAPGFGQSRLANVELQARQTVRIDGKLFLARQAQTVASVIQPGTGNRLLTGRPLGPAQSRPVAMVSSCRAATARERCSNRLFQQASKESL